MPARLGNCAVRQVGSRCGYSSANLSGRRAALRPQLCQATLAVRIHSCRSQRSAGPRRLLYVQDAACRAGVPPHQAARVGGPQTERPVAELRRRPCRPSRRASGVGRAPARHTRRAACPAARQAAGAAGEAAHQPTPARATLLTATRMRSCKRCCGVLRQRHIAGLDSVQSACRHQRAGTAAWPVPPFTTPEVEH